VRFNPGISFLFHEYRHLNKAGPVLFSTIQSYLIESSAILEHELQVFRKLGVKPAFKIVRGAYML
jgi:hypothetical protein